jgi:Ser/Thr protein kinase RdoA (MazF antagonist)
MDCFPISKSFLQRDALSQRIEEEYGLENVACQLISSTLRDVYLVTSSQGHRILYVYLHAQRTSEEIAAEWQLVDYLYASGVSVAPAVPKISGDYVLMFPAPEGIRFGVLTQFAEGVTLRSRPSLAAARSYGKTVAMIHTLSDVMPFSLNRPAIEIEKLLEQSLAAFEREVLDRPEDLAFLLQAAAILQKRIVTLLKAKPCYGIIHGDVIRSNALVTDDGRVTILDFDLCGFGWRAYDVASYLLTIRNTPQPQDYEQAFIEGYQQVRPIEAEERELLPAFEAIRAIFSIGTPAMHIEHWGSQYFYAFLDASLMALKSSMLRMK